MPNASISVLPLRVLQRLQAETTLVQQSSPPLDKGLT